MPFAVRVFFGEILIVACFANIEVKAFQTVEEHSPNWIALAFVTDSKVMEHIIFYCVLEPVE